MYIPPSFRFDDPAKLSAFMNAHSFATLITCESGVPFASHLPMRHTCDSNVCTTLVSHMARSNPQWKHFASQTEVLTIFAGPHAYISPSWYATDRAVPTWNYATVHVYGRPRIMGDHEVVVALLADTIEFYERSFDRPVTEKQLDASRRVNLENILELALINNRAYQSRKEALYAVALRLSLQRFQYDLRFF